MGHSAANGVHFMPYIVGYIIFYGLYHVPQAGTIQSQFCASFKCGPQSVCVQVRVCLACVCIGCVCVCLADAFASLISKLRCLCKLIGRWHHYYKSEKQLA